MRRSILQRAPSVAGGAEPVPALEQAYAEEAARYARRLTDGETVRTPGTPLSGLREFIDRLIVDEQGRQVLIRTLVFDDGSRGHERLVFQDGRFVPDEPAPEA